MATVQEIIEHCKGITVIEYMANIRADIDTKDWCCTGEVHDATRWAEHELNQQAEEIERLQAENARITFLYNQSLKLVHDSKVYERMLLDGSDHAGVPVEEDSISKQEPYSADFSPAGYAYVRENKSGKTVAKFNSLIEARFKAKALNTEATHADDATAEAVE